MQKPDNNKLNTARGLFEATRKGSAWTPRNVLLAVVAIVYFISPIDLIPDWIFPVVGWLDDLGVIAAVIYWITRKQRQNSGKKAQ